MCLNAGVVVASISDDIDRAQQLLDGKDYDGAIQFLQRVPAGSSHAPKILRLIGMCYQEKTDWTSAIATFSNLLTTCPNAEPEVSYAKKELAKCYIAAKSLDSAITLAEGALAKYPNDKLYWLRRLSEYYSNKPDLVKEVQILQRLANEFPNTQQGKDAAFALADCLCVQGKVQDGIAQIDALLTRYPDMQQQILEKRKALRYKYLGDFSEISDQEKVYLAGRIASLKNTLATNPNVEPNAKDAGQELAKCYSATKAWDSAIALAEEALTKYPESRAYWLRRLSDYCLSKGDFAKGAVNLKKLIDEFPERTEAKDAKVSMAECMCGQGQIQEGLAQLDNLLIQYPELRESILVSKGDMLFNYAKDYDAAIAVYSSIASEVTRMRITDDMMLRQKKPVEARKMFAKLIEANPKSENAVEWDFFRGVCSMTADNWADARADFKAFYDKHPANEWQVQAKYYEGECCAQLKDKAGAQAAYTEIETKFPSSSFANLASKRLATINMEAASK